MKIEIDKIDQESFMVHDHVLNGEMFHLVQPQHINCKWTQKNKHFRSSLWNVDGELVSASFPKFTNWGENPENFPVPTSLDNTTIVDKIDGSTCIIDYTNGTISMRTRGTVTYESADNKNDFEICLSKYPKLIEWLKSNSNYSLLTEITTPNNRIVIRYGDDPEFWLTGAIDKVDYSLMPQKELDVLANNLGMIRPNTYKFSTIADLLTNVEKWTGKEGVCLYSSDGQNIWKIKSSEYLIKHRLKDEFRNLEKILDFYISEKCPSYHEFYDRVAQIVDFETATEIRGDISRCIDAWKDVQKIINGMMVFVNDTLSKLPSRKEQAIKIMSSYGTTNRSQYVFSILDSRPLTDDQIRKLFWQVLKK